MATQLTQTGYKISKAKEMQGYLLKWLDWKSFGVRDLKSQPMEFNLIYFTAMQSQAYIATINKRITADEKI